MSVLVIDVGTSNVRASTVEDDGSISCTRSLRLPPQRPAPGLSEFDPNELAQAVLDVAREVSGASGHGAIGAVGVAAQRASTMLWNARTGQALGVGLGWQDLRTVGLCLSLQASGIRLAPNQSATKLSWLLGQARDEPLEDLRFSTIESWIAAVLSQGSLHASDLSNAAVTGLLTMDGSDWDDTVLGALQIPRQLLPRLVDSSGQLAEARALPNAPLIAALIGDQQASLIGQGCLEQGEAKLTLGTGAMLDCSLGGTRPDFSLRGEAGTFPIIAWREHNELHWGLEAIMLAAGSCVDWLCSGLGILTSPADSAEIAGSVRDAGGVLFVPAFGGIGTPIWDFGARGALLGLDGSVTRAQIVRAVLEGIAQRAVDLIEAVEADGQCSIGQLRVDGGMSANATFVQILANASGHELAIAPVVEATTLGAAFLAGTAVGTWRSLREACSTVAPRALIQPSASLDRERWLTARDHALGTVPALSALKF